jgi:hypothetical protein
MAFLSSGGVRLLRVAVNRRTAAIALVLAAATVGGLGVLVAHRETSHPLQPALANASASRPDRAPTALDYTPPPSIRATIEPDPTAGAPDQHALVCRVDCEALLREASLPSSKLLCRVDFDELLKESRIRQAQTAAADAIEDRIRMDPAVRHARQILEEDK